MFKEYVIKPFLNSLEKHPESNAFCIDSKFYTYTEFARNISKIRNAVEDTKTRTLNIGLVVNDDIETYASIFALWFEGYSYVPLHPKQPLERNLEVVLQAEINLVLDSSSISEFGMTSVIETSKLHFHEMNLEPKVIADDMLAYILFTSGSTGQPKGVTITRKNVGAFMKAFWEVGINIQNSDKCLQSFDLTFDVSVQSYLVPLTKGACTYTVPHDQIKYTYVYGLLEEHQLTFGALPPSLIRYLRPYFDEINIKSMRYCIVTAEASPVDLIEEWAKCIPNAEIFNFYGPTEATIYCTSHKFQMNKRNKQLNGMLSIGKAIPGIEAVIIDDKKNILANNQKGELCLHGDQVTLGYWNNPEKNSQSFFEIDYKEEKTRFYKTGDSCYFDDDGDIMLVGRIDHQVKVQGYRVELGEIEYHVRAFLKGQNAVASAFNNAMGNAEIALFVEGVLPDNSVLLEYLKSKMPYYMIPSKIIVEKNFPINTSGKVDRVYLRNSLK
jgi:D-alanine--poly(phosphoribitol) ligase subunit 1